MIPLTTKFGQLFKKLKDNSSYNELNKELTSIAKKIRYSREDNVSLTKYILKKSFFKGETESIIIGHKEDTICSIGINSIDPYEHNMISNLLINSYPYYEILEENKGMRIYIDYNEEYIILTKQTVLFKKLNNVLFASKNDR